jgi:two-component system response regulator
VPKDITVNEDAVNKNNPIEILLAEDNLGDVFLTKKALAESKINHNITVAFNGEDLLSILKKREKNKRKIPDLILLDLHMPKKDGKEALAEIKSDDKLKHIPIMVFSSSKAQEDIAESYGLHANCYLVKPDCLSQYKKLIHTIESFWFSLVILPVQ